MLLLKKDETTAARRRVPILLVDSSDGYTPETGVSISAGDVKISKNGAAEGNHAGTLTELAGGLYYYEFTSGEVDTVGFLSLRVNKTGIRQFYGIYQVVKYDPYEDVWNDADTELSALPTATSSVKSKIKYLWQYFAHRNKATSLVQTLYKADGTTSLATATISETGSETDRGAFS